MLRPPMSLGLAVSMQTLSPKILQAAVTTDPSVSVSFDSLAALFGKILSYLERSTKLEEVLSPSKSTTKSHGGKIPFL
jgi:hypothetical protein